MDVREEDEFHGALGHIPNAELVPLGTVEKRAKDWDREQPIAVVCRSGGRSGRAALVMEKLGFRRVVSVRGGMLEWNRKASEPEAPVICG